MKFKIEKKLKNYFIISILILVAFFVGIKILTNNISNTSSNIKYVKIAGQSIKVDLALTQEEQEQGLSGRSSLRDNEGMLFIFDHPGIYPFWMKEMNFPIDIIWIVPDEMGTEGDLRVVYIQKNATPDSYPKTFSPNVNAKYVLEVVSGFSDKNNLKVGEPVSLDIGM